jgi:CubicO group peptidase (beta-lactamase class C family)
LIFFRCAAAFRTDNGENIMQKTSIHGSGARAAVQDKTEDGGADVYTNANVPLTTEGRKNNMRRRLGGFVAVLAAVFFSAQGWAQVAPAAPVEHKQIKLDAKTFDGYVGRYKIRQNLIVTISRDGDHYYSQTVDQPRTEIFPESKTEFFAKTSPLDITFDVGTSGKVTDIVLHQGAREIPGKRLVELTAEGVKAQCAAFDAIVAAAFAKQPIGSVTVGVVLGKDLVWTKSYGDADMEKKIPADKDTIYRIGSITKMFTALMLEQLVDTGKVHLSDPVEKYLPEVNVVQGRYPNAPPITLFELATHTAGFSSEPDHIDTYVHGPVSQWQKTLFAALAEVHYINEPGTRYSYSNIGFGTLGAAIERPAGQPYIEYVPKHIFEPLGMTHSAFDYSPWMAAHLSMGYDVHDGKVDWETPLREHEGRGYKVPNGAMYTTVGDLGHFASFLMGLGPESVLPTQSLAKFQQLAVQGNTELSSGYGLGGMYSQRDGYIAFGHGGSVAGYLASLEVNKDARVAVIALTNGPINPGGLSLRGLDLLSQ